ncbi:sulfotransferase [Dichotomicrobium thermohalophilum]|nr:sulfotransferase [Dichotomicrobium thermohalophilum]
MEIIKQFGLQRSGTNALRGIIEVNLDLRVAANILGDKHSSISWAAMEDWAAEMPLPKSLSPKDYNRLLDALHGRTLKFILSVKDPVSWVNSYFRYSKKKFEHKNPEKILDFTTRFAEKSLFSWQERMKSYADFIAQNAGQCFVVQHEKLLISPESVLADFCRKFDFPFPDDPELFLEGYARRGTDEQQGDMLINRKMRFNRDFHLEGQWMRDMPEDVLEQAVAFRDDVFGRHPEIRSLFDVETIGLTVAAPSRKLSSGATRPA